MHRFTFILCLLSILFFGAHTDARSRDVDWSRVHTLTIQGIHQLYDMEIDESLRTFKQVTAMAPGDPRGYFFEAMVAFWKFGLLGQQGEYEHFLALADTVIDVCDAVLDRDENNAEAHFFLGGIYGYRGMARRSQGSLVPAVFDGRKGYSHLQDALRIDPQLYDAQMGLGLFEYMIAKAPKSLTWLLSTLGYPGSTEGGLAALKMAAEKGTYARTEAKFFLAQLLFNEHRQDEAFQYMQALTVEYPGNSLFLANESTMYRRMGNLDSALVLAERAMRVNNAKKIRYAEEFVYSTLASVQFSLNNFADARKNYDAYMEKVGNKTLITNWILYRYGLCQEILGDRDAAVKTYRLARSTDDAPMWEVRSVRLCGIRANEPLGKTGAFVVAAENLMDRKLYGAADSLLGLALRTGENDEDMKGQALIDRAQIQLDRNDNAAVIASCASIRNLTIRHETWIPPRALYLQGMAYANLGRKDDALLSFREARGYDDYESQDHLERQIKEEEKKLEVP